MCHLQKPSATGSAGHRSRIGAIPQFVEQHQSRLERNVLGVYDGNFPNGRVPPLKRARSRSGQLLANTGDHGLGLCRHLPVIVRERRQRSCTGPRAVPRTRDYWSRVMITLEKLHDGIWLVWRALTWPSEYPPGPGSGGRKWSDRGFQHPSVWLVLGHPRPCRCRRSSCSRHRGRAKAPGRGPWGGPVSQDPPFYFSPGSGSAALAGAYQMGHQPASSSYDGVQPAHHPGRHRCGRGGGKRKKIYLFETLLPRHAQCGHPVLNEATEIFLKRLQVMPVGRSQVLKATFTSDSLNLRAKS